MVGLQVGTVFVLLMIYLVLGKSGVEGGDRRSVSRKQEEEDLELERQLKLLNKPAVKSIKTEFGDIYDCVDIKKQAAFDHPLLTNHTIQFATFGLVRSHRKYYGGFMYLGIDQPKVSSINQFSEAVLWVENGPIDQLNSIQVGWTVNPKLFGDNKTRIFFLLEDGFHKTDCFNLLCPGFVQVSRKVPLGYPYGKISIYGGQHYEANFVVFKDQKSGNWWFVGSIPGGHEPIGYWPSSLFTTLRDSASMVTSGGEVYSPTTSETSPQMGNGHFPPIDRDKITLSSYATKLQIVDDRHFLVDPHASLLNIQMDSPACYQAESVLAHDENWINSILFGGSGAACGI